MACTSSRVAGGCEGRPSWRGWCAWCLCGSRTAVCTVKLGLGDSWRPASLWGPGRPFPPGQLAGSESAWQWPPCDWLVQAEGLDSRATAAAARAVASATGSPSPQSCPRPPRCSSSAGRPGPPAAAPRAAAPAACPARRRCVAGAAHPSSPRPGPRLHAQPVVSLRSNEASRHTQQLRNIRSMASQGAGAHPPGAGTPRRCRAPPGAASTAGHSLPRRPHSGPATCTPAAPRAAGPGPQTSPWAAASMHPLPGLHTPAGAAPAPAGHWAGR